MPHWERVALSECLQAGHQLRAVILLTGGMVLVEAVRIDAGNQKRIALKISALRPIGLRYPHVPDEHETDGLKISIDYVTTQPILRKNQILSLIQ